MDRLDFSALSFEQLIGREWLVVNHLGGFASSTLPGLNTRKYHGLLVASMSPPVRRMVLLSRVEETVYCNGWPSALACNEYPGTIFPQGQQFLRAFSPHPCPRWAFQGDGWTLEKSLCLLDGQNTVCLTYTLLGGEQPVDFELRPLMALRGIHELMYQWNARLDPETRDKQHHRIPPTTRTPEVFFAHDGRFAPQSCWYFNTIYRREQERGYGGLEDLWLPGVVRWTLSPGQSAHFICSTDPIDLPAAIQCAEREVARAASAPTEDQTLAALLRAADQFVTRSPAVVTQFPWAPPSGRSALIAMPGLFLVPGRIDEAKAVLRSFIAHLRRGLMPSEFPEDGSTPRYEGADVSLWFANAVHNYLRYATEDMEARQEFFDALETIIRAYQHGTELGISGDADGLLISRADGVGTSWMDAKVGDWVVTPRQGRPVELNALWYNALRIAAELASRLRHPARAEELASLAESVRAAFNRRFWNYQAECCFDVVGDESSDASVRPNQLFAVSLPYPVLVPDRHAKVLQKVRAELLIPTGVRTLSPRDPNYQGQYGGDVVRRDRAYHQGTAYPWLLGALASATVRLHGRSDAARREALTLIEPCIRYMGNEGMGQICELFDGDAPHHPGGAIASARAVGEILRCYAEDVLGSSSNRSSSAGKVPQLT